MLKSAPVLFTLNMKNSPKKKLSGPYRAPILPRINPEVAARNDADGAQFVKRAMVVAFCLAGLTGFKSCDSDVSADNVVVSSPDSK